MGTYKTEIKWGVIFTLVMLLWMVFERLMGWHGENIEQHATMSIIFAVVAIAIYVFALLDKRKNDLGGRMTWSQGFASGFWITLVVVVLSPLAQFITHTVISPDFFNNMTNYAVESGNMTREQAESYFSMRNYLIQSAVGALGLGVVTSAVVAIFTKKK
jgi:hypothetical membrane protein